MGRNGFVDRDTMLGLIVMAVGLLVAYYLIEHLMRSGPMLLISGAIAVSAGILIYFLYARRLAKEMQTLQGTQRLAADVIQELQAGDISIGGFQLPVQLQGTVDCETQLSEAAGAAPCAYHVLRVMRVDNGEQVYNETKTAPFWVKDRSGRIKVVPDGAQFELPPPTEQFLAQEDVDGSPWKQLLHRFADKGSHGFRLFEQTIAAGQRVKVVGLASDTLGELAVMRSERADQPFLISAGQNVTFAETRRRQWVTAMALSAVCVLGGAAMAGFGATTWLTAQQSGEIFVRNDTHYLVRLTVDKVDRTLHQFNWLYLPLHGTNYPHGTHLTDWLLGKEEPVELSPGDQVSLIALRPEPPVQLVAGVSPSLTYNAADASWRVTITENLLAEARHAPVPIRPSVPVVHKAVPPATAVLRSQGGIWVKPQTNRRVEVELRDAQGQIKGEKWSFEPLEDETTDQNAYWARAGYQLDYHDKPVYMQRGDILTLTVLRPSAPVEGVIGQEGFLKWNANGKYWYVTLTDDLFSGK